MIQRALTPSLLLVLLVAAGGAALGEDWPTFMHDNQRTGVSEETLRPPLALRWEFDSPFPPAEGWSPAVNGYGARKSKPNVSYDDAFRVIAVGDSCYFASSAENRVYAVEASTGRIRWARFTDAAPRLAPAYREGRLYVGADDGVFRCLDASDGQVVWEIHARPHPDLMLGHGRFSSVWPIRSAGIVDGGIVYFTAGLFPSNHLYLYAVGADDGELLWRRQLDRGGACDHVPQGYVLATDDSLFTTSRAVPARWSKADGSRIDFNTPFPQVPKAHEYRFYNGGTYAQVFDDRYVVYGRACILAYDPDKVLTDRWGRERKGDLLFNWFGARQALFQGETAYLATDEHVLAVRRELLPELARNECKEYEETYKKLRVASYLDHLEEHDRLVEQHGEDHWKVRWLETGPLKWGRGGWQQWPRAAEAIFAKLRRRCAWMTPLEATDAFIGTGDVIYAGSDDRVHALDAADGRELWSFATQSRVRGLAAANGRLYVSTIDGKIRCFTKESVAGGPITVSPVAKGSPYRDDPLGTLHARTASEIVEAVDERTGYCLILGGGNGSLAAKVAALTDFRIEVLEPDAEKVAEARTKLAAAGFYGGRVCVRQVTSDELPYPPYVFNLVVDQGSFSRGRASARVSEIFRVTKPSGGVALLGIDAAEIASELKRLEREGATTSRRGGLWRVERGRVPKSKDWTHNYATAANTYSNEDPHVKGPFGVLWYGEPGPRKRIERHASPPVPLVVGGTMFTIGYDLVMAYDIYNGTLSWEREIRGATRESLPINTSNLVADAESLFIVIDNRECLRLAARTGETIATYSVPGSDDGEPGGWAWVAREGSFLYGSRAEREASGRRFDPQKSEAVFALGVESGDPAWVYRGRGIDHDGIAVGGGRVLFLDGGLSDTERDEARRSAVRDTSVVDREAVDRKGKPIPRDLRKLVALDSATGKPLWERPWDVTDVTLDDAVVQGRGGVACMVHDGVAVLHGTGSLGHPHKEFLEGKFARRALYAFDAATGRFLWGGRKGYRKRPIIVGDHVYAEPFAWHLRTGTPKTTPNPLSGRPQVLDFHRGYIGCGHLLASGSALFGARGGIACYNLDDPAGFAAFGGMALACGLGAVPAGGVFVAPEGRSGCTCDVPIHTSVALYPKRGPGGWSTGFSGGRAEVVSLPVRHASVNLGGPAYRRDEEGYLWIPYPARTDAGVLGDWLPTYQHDESMCYRLDELHTEITGTDAPWVFTSGYAYEKPLRFPMLERGSPPATYTVKLYFAEPEAIQPGQRRFHVYLQGKRVLEDFDPIDAAGERWRAVVEEFEGVEVDGHLEIRMEPATDAVVKKPVLCGFQALRE